MKEEISTETHKRWYENYMAERGVIEAESQNVNKVNVERREKVVRVLPTWVDLKSLYRKASDGQKTTC
ncbi:hypothetical protein PV783_25130 [Chitinophaga sp. CC14]|uniref:hypothetical protein n=1 Tax=Chitinophaga sp. CC14 TaxID=3029199 RepID=UPI003B7ECB37